MSLPDGIDYSAQKHDSLVADSQLIEIQPMNGRTFNCGSHIILEFPNRPFSFYDLESSTLSMTVTNNDGHYVEFDTTVASLIQRMTVTNAGAVLSDIVDYNKVHNVVMDYQVSREERSTRMAVTSGNKVPVDMAAAAVAPATSGVVTKGSARLGQQLDASGGSGNFSTQLIGSIFSANKYIAANLASPLTLNLYLDSAKQAFVCENTGIVDSDIVISDVRLQFQSIRLEPSVYNSVASKGFAFQCEDYSTSRSTVETTATSHTVTLPFRYSKLKSIYHMFQLQTDLTAFGSKSQSKRLRFDDLKWTEYYLNIAGTKYPAMSTQRFNVFEKLMQSVGVSGYDAHQISVSAAECEGDAFLIGIDLEAVRNKGSELLSGANTTQSTISPVITFGAAGARSGVVAVTHIAVFDNLIQLDPLTRTLVLST